MAKKLKSKLILCNVPTVNNDAARRFYSALIGEDLARGLNPQVESYFAPLSRDGVDLTITQRFDDSERLTCYFAVDNLDQAIGELEGLGGEIVIPPRDVELGPQEARDFYVREKKKKGQDVRDPGKVGRMAVMLDPDRNHVGLMQLAEHAQPHFKVGRYQEGLDDEQVAEFKAAKEAGRLVGAGPPVTTRWRPHK